MRVDSHVHFWRFEPDEYPWISAEMEVLKRDRLPAEARIAFDEQRIDRCVAVQARENEQETDFLLALASTYDWIGAVIGWVDLTHARLSQRLEHWADAKRLTGFRHILQHDSAAGALISSRGFRRGVRQLQDRSMLYEILITADQLPLVHEFCREHNRHWLILDHLGKPDIRNRQFDTWVRDLKPLARLPHVVCKLSGMLTEANDASGGFDEDHLCKYLETALDLFGPQRLMFGSDWPVCLLVRSYRETTQVLERWSSKLTPVDREWIWGRTAAQVYRLARRKP
jgi:L-fuconolactonase